MATKGAIAARKQVATERLSVAARALGERLNTKLTLPQVNRSFDPDLAVAITLESIAAWAEELLAALPADKPASKAEKAKAK